MADTCARCGSTKVMPDVPLQDHYGDTGSWSKQGEVDVHTNPKAWFFKGTVSGKISARICGECGFTELWVSNYRESVRGVPGIPPGTRLITRRRNAAEMTRHLRTDDS